jgi:alanine racemase
MMQLPAGRQTYAVIDVAALRHNYSYIRSKVAPDVSMLTVVKANAYGHGATIAGPTFEKAGAEWLGVATVGEAVELRSAGVNIPILVLSGAGAGDIGLLHRFHLTIALLDIEMARELAAAAQGTRIRVHIKVDTGMGRIGVLPEDLRALLDEIRSGGALEVDGIFTHFGNADDVRGPHCDTQVERFRQALEILKTAGFDPP